jgi:hypothetical protein
VSFINVFAKIAMKIEITNVCMKNIEMASTG